MKITIELIRNEETGLQSLRVTPEGITDHVYVIAMLEMAKFDQINTSNRLANEKVINLYKDSLINGLKE